MPKSRKNQTNNKKRQRSTKKQHGGAFGDKTKVKAMMNIIKEGDAKIIKVINNEEGYDKHETLSLIKVTNEGNEKGVDFLQEMYRRTVSGLPLLGFEPSSIHNAYKAYTKVFDVATKNSKNQELLESILEVPQVADFVTDHMRQNNLHRKIDLTSTAISNICISATQYGIYDLFMSLPIKKINEALKDLTHEAIHALFTKLFLFSHETQIDRMKQAVNRIFTISPNSDKSPAPEPDKYLTPENINKIFTAIVNTDYKVQGRETNLFRSKQYADKTTTTGKLDQVKTTELLENATKSANDLLKALSPKEEGEEEEEKEEEKEKEKPTELLENATKSANELLKALSPKEEDEEIKELLETSQTLSIELLDKLRPSMTGGDNEPFTGERSNLFGHKLYNSVDLLYYLDAEKYQAVFDAITDEETLNKVIQHIIEVQNQKDYFGSPNRISGRIHSVLKNVRDHVNNLDALKNKLNEGTRDALTKALETHVSRIPFGTSKQRAQERRKQYAYNEHKKLVLDLLKAKKEEFQKDPKKTVETNNINAIIAVLDQTAPLKDIQLFDDLLKMHSQTSSKNERTKIYKEIADFYIKNICEGVKDHCEIPEGNKPLKNTADKAEIQKNNAENKKNSERKTRLRNRIKHIIKGLKNPAFVTRVQAYSNKNKRDETQFTLEDTRRILVEILDKYNSNNYLNLDDVIETFFPETYDVFSLDLGDMTNRIQKKTVYGFKAYRSEFEPDKDENSTEPKFGSLVHTKKVTYPHNSMDYYKDRMQEVESLFSIYGTQANKDRDPERNKPVLERTYDVVENKYYPIDGVGDGLENKKIDTEVTFGK